MLLYCDLLILSWLDWGCGFGGGGPRSKMPFLSCHIKEYSVNVTYYCWCWPWSIGWGGVYQVSSCKVTLLSLFSMLYCLERNLHSPCLKRGQLIYVNYFKFFCIWEFLFFSFTFLISYLLVPVWAHKYLFLCHGV